MKVKVLSIGVTCPECIHHQDVDSSEFDSDKLVAFCEYTTTCDSCDHEYSFELDVFE